MEKYTLKYLVSTRLMKEEVYVVKVFPRKMFILIINHFLLASIKMELIPMEN